MRKFIPYLLAIILSMGVAFAGIGINPVTGKIDLTGSSSSTASGSGARLYNVPAVTANSIVASGDSITFGATVNANQAYPVLMAVDLGVTATNGGVNGRLACDVADLQDFLVTPTATRNPLYTHMIGTNDANTKGVGTYEAVSQTCHLASLSWLAIPDTFKVLGQNASCVQSGTWANSAAYGGAMGVQSSTNASVLTCTITTYGRPIYAWYRLDDAKTGTFTYSVDGGTASSTYVTNTTPAINTQNGGVNGVGFIRIPSISAGSHTVAFTVTSTTNATKLVTILGVGTTSPYQYYQGPMVFAAGVPYQQADANSAASAEYNTNMLADVATLYADGLNVYPVYVRNYLANSEMNDALHPNVLGQQHIRDAFEAAMQFYPRLGAGVDGTVLFNNGNVGIATTIPAGALDVVYNLNSSAGGFRVKNNNTGSSAFTGLKVNNDAKNDPTGLLRLSSTNTQYRGPNSLMVYTPDTTTPFSIVVADTPRMDFGVNGNIGIGTHIPRGKFEVVGNIGIGTISNSLWVTTAPPNGGLLVEKNVVICTVTPGANLDVGGSIRSTLGSSPGTNTCWCTTPPGVMGYCTGVLGTCSACNYNGSGC